MLRRLPGCSLKAAPFYGLHERPAFGADLIDGVHPQAQAWSHRNMENHAEFPDADIEYGLKALVFKLHG